MFFAAIANNGGVLWLPRVVIRTGLFSQSFYLHIIHFFWRMILQKSSTWCLRYLQTSINIELYMYNVYVVKTNHIVQFLTKKNDWHSFHKDYLNCSIFPSFNYQVLSLAFITLYIGYFFLLSKKPILWSRLLLSYRYQMTNTLCILNIPTTPPPNDLP